jgi:hypothetical protein
MEKRIEGDRNMGKELGAWKSDRWKGKEMNWEQGSIKK